MSRARERHEQFKAERRDTFRKWFRLGIVCVILYVAVFVFGVQFTLKGFATALVMIAGAWLISSSVGFLIPAFIFLSIFGVTPGEWGYVVPIVMDIAKISVDNVHAELTEMTGEHNIQEDVNTAREWFRDPDFRRYFAAGFHATQLASSREARESFDDLDPKHWWNAPEYLDRPWHPANQHVDHVRRAAFLLEKEAKAEAEAAAREERIIREAQHDIVMGLGNIRPYGGQTAIEILEERGLSTNFRDWLPSQARPVGVGTNAQ